MSTYQTVVIGVHNSPTGRRAVELAAPLSSETGAKLVLVAAYEPTRHQSRSADPYQEPGSPSARRALEGAEEICRRMGVSNFESHAVAGDPVTALTQAVREYGADLLLVGNHGLSTLGGRLLGSVPGGVSREADCDVLVVHTTDDHWWEVLRPRRRATRYQRTVVVGVDDSEHSERAAKRAAKVACDFGAALVLVGVYEESRPADLKRASDALGAESFLVQGTFSIEGVLRDAVAAARGCGVPDVETIVVKGDAIHGLLKVADKYSADILVLGNHRLSGRVAGMLGSISEQVSRKAATHVLLVH